MRTARSTFPTLLAFGLATLAALATGCAVAADPSPRGPGSPSSSGEGDPGADDDDGAAPRFVATSCRYVVPKSREGSAVRCGDVLVPENRAKPGSRTIKIHVAIFPGRDDLPPVFELIGGPGGGGDPMVGYLAAGDPKQREDYGFLRERGDFVVFDQRGVGRSLPNLSCAEEMAAASMTSSFMGIMTSCRDRLEKEGVDLAAYTTYDNALDVDDIRRALGYDAIDLHAISYGTLLALEVMRHRPEAIRSVVIDGVVPPEVKLISDTPRTIDENVTRIFSACAAQPSCKGAFPDLESSLSKLKVTLDAAPFTAGGEPFDWYAFVELLVGAMYDAGGVRQIPLWVHDLAARGQAAFDDLVAAEEAAFSTPPGPRDAAVAEVDAALDALARDPLAAAKYLGMNDGMYTSVTCSDSGQYETFEDAVSSLAGVRPGLRDEQGIKEQLEICAMWPKSAKRATTKLPVASAIPTLSLGGEFDPVTPAAWAEQAAKTLSRSHYFMMKALAHGSMDACSRGMKSAFFDAPLAKPDASCNDTRAMTFATGWSAPSAFRSGKRPSLRPRPVAAIAAPAVRPSVLVRPIRGR